MAFGFCGVHRGHAWSACLPSTSRGRPVMARLPWPYHALRQKKDGVVSASRGGTRRGPTGTVAVVALLHCLADGREGRRSAGMHLQTACSPLDGVPVREQQARARIGREKLRQIVDNRRIKHPGGARADSGAGKGVPLARGTVVIARKLYFIHRAKATSSIGGHLRVDRVEEREKCGRRAQPAGAVTGSVVCGVGVRRMCCLCLRGGAHSASMMLDVSVTPRG